jgi:BCD family chlorophyll transporter-like MFS transporter
VPDEHGHRALAALPVNLFNRLMTVELAWPAILPGLLVALHYGVQFTRPYWGHRSDAKGGGRPSSWAVSPWSALG